MPSESHNVAPGSRPEVLKFEDGSEHPVPRGWALLPPGDALITRRVKGAGPSWTVREKKGRKLFSHGVWAPRETIESKQAEVEAERDTPAYQKKLAASRGRAQKTQEQYVEDFSASVLSFLGFHTRHAELGQKLAAAVTVHATPVGSGTVARTKRIPVEQRAESAVIAWMRHQTTAYDNMSIARVKGERRKVRRMLAQRSRELLNRYRTGGPTSELCPLAQALSRVD